VAIDSLSALRSATAAVLLAVVAAAAFAGCIDHTGSSANDETQYKSDPPRVRLVLQITVDQLRGDLLDRYGHRFGDDGFRRLLDSGVVYTDAHYSHANTETIVGHTTLATGTTPSQHGMIGNVWYDRSAGRVVYNIEDAEHDLVGEIVGGSSPLFGPATVAHSKGRSPMAILASTFTDELSKATNGRSRVFSVALKDRAAVPMAGKSGKAIWYSNGSGRFVSSAYYFDQAPSWLVEFNTGRSAARFADSQWELLEPKTSYLFGQHDDRPFESMMGLFGRTFPHAFGSVTDPSLAARVACSPAGDEMVAELATLIVDKQQLGQREVVDYLAVGFSATDYIGHTFGPSSLEAEDNILQLDRTLAGLLDHIDEKVGLSATLVVLSADHGVSGAPEALRAQGIDAQRLSADALEGTELRARIAQRFGSGDLVVGFIHPYVHLNRKRIAAAGLELADAQRFAAGELALVEGVERAVAAADMNHATDAPLPLRLVADNHHEIRSGDVYVVPRAHWLPYSGTRMRALTATHGSPWPYDRHVPIVFSGPGIEPARIARPVEPKDIAPTLSAYLAVEAPSKTTGNVLEEVVPTR